jgi:hypothetical protein
MYLLILKPTIRLYFKFDPNPRGYGEFAAIVHRERGERSARLAILLLALPQVFIGTALLGLPLVLASMAGLKNDVEWAILAAIGYWPSMCGLVWLTDSIRFLHRGEEWAELLDGPGGKRHTAILGFFGGALAIVAGFATIAIFPPI